MMSRLNISALQDNNGTSPVSTIEVQMGRAAKHRADGTPTVGHKQLICYMPVLVSRLFALLAAAALELMAIPLFPSSSRDHQRELHDLIRRRDRLIYSQDSPIQKAADTPAESSLLSLTEMPYSSGP
jgi:hypothetical protein